MAVSPTASGAGGAGGAGARPSAPELQPGVVECAAQQGQVCVWSLFPPFLCLQTGGALLLPLLKEKASQCWSAQHEAAQSAAVAPVCRLVAR